MKTIDKLEKVASIAIHAKTHASAYTIADTIVKLNRLGQRSHRLATQIVNGIADDAERVRAKQKLAKIVIAAGTLAHEKLGLKVDDSDDGMGYLQVAAPATNRVIATFGGET